MGPLLVVPVEEFGGPASGKADLINMARSFSSPPVATAFWLDGVRSDGLLFTLSSACCCCRTYYWLQQEKRSGHLLYFYSDWQVKMIIRNVLVLVLLPALAYLKVHYGCDTCLPHSMEGILPAVYGVSIVLFFSALLSPPLNLRGCRGGASTSLLCIAWQYTVPAGYAGAYPDGFCKGIPAGLGQCVRASLALGSEGPAATHDGFGNHTVLGAAIANDHPA